MIWLTRPCYNYLKFKTDALLFKLTISTNHVRAGGGGGGVVQSKERATPGEEILRTIPAVADRSLLVGIYQS